MSASLELAGAGVDREAILKALNLNPRDPKTQALLLVCERYELDPLLKHMVLISGNPYITRDGYLAIAHRTGKFDGLEVLEEGADQTHWWAKVAVWRKDMSHPFTYVGRYPKSGHQKQYGPEMAIKCAEVMGLRRAFNVTGVAAVDERWDEDAATATAAPDVEAYNARRGRGPQQEHDVEVDAAPQVVQSKPRTFPAPGQSQPKNQDEFTADDQTLASPEEMRALRKELADLDETTLEAVSKKWVDARLPSIKTRKQIDKADYERALTLVLDVKEAVAAEVQAEPFFEDGDGGEAA